MRFLVCNQNVAIGGGSSLALKLAATLRELGHEVEALVTTADGGLMKEYSSVFRRVRLVSRGLATRREILLRVGAAMSEADADVVVNNGEAFVQAAFSAVWPRAVTFAVIHGKHPSEVAIGTSNGAFVDRMVAVSASIQQVVRSRTAGRSVEVIPVGAMEADAERVTRLSLERLRVAYVGRLSHADKNLPLLLEVLEGLRSSGVDFDMEFVGDGEARPDLERQIRRRRLQDRTKFRGEVSLREASSAMLRADILLLTSDSEGTPHAVVEAMAAGAVTVCSAIEGSTSDVVTDGVDGFLCTRGDPAMFVDRLRLLAREPTLLGEMSRAARRKALGRFSMRSVAARYLDAVEAVRSTTARPRRGPDVSGAHFSIPDELKPFCPGVGWRVREAIGRTARRALRVARSEIGG